MSVIARPAEGIHSFNALESVPPEILIEIFVLCPTSSDPLAPLNLAKVSHLWRQVVQVDRTCSAMIHSHLHYPVVSKSLAVPLSG